MRVSIVVLVASIVMTAGSNMGLASFRDADLFVKAAEKGDIFEIKKLLDKGVDINGKDKNGHTALMGAVFNKQIQTVRFLLEKGADLEVKDWFGSTAKEYASEEVMKILKRHETEMRKEPKQRSARDVYKATTATIALRKESDVTIVKIVLGVGSRDAAQRAMVERMAFMLKKGDEVYVLGVGKDGDSVKVTRTEQTEEGWVPREHLIKKE
jgi:hypothetical protein